MRPTALYASMRYANLLRNHVAGPLMSLHVYVGSGGPLLTLSRTHVAQAST